MSTMPTLAGAVKCALDEEQPTDEQIAIAVEEAERETAAAVEETIAALVETIAPVPS